MCVYMQQELLEWTGLDWTGVCVNMHVCVQDWSGLDRSVEWKHIFFDWHMFVNNLVCEQARVDYCCEG